MARAPGYLRPGQTLRIALHPDDLRRPGLREAALKGIDVALSAGANAITYETLMSIFSSEVDLRNQFVPYRPLPDRLEIEALGWMDFPS
jgi:hypothetical protein